MTIVYLSLRWIQCVSPLALHTDNALRRITDHRTAAALVRLRDSCGIPDWLMFPTRIAGQGGPHEVDPSRSVVVHCSGLSRARRVFT